MRIPQMDEWAGKRIKKLAADRPDIGIKPTDTDTEALLKVCRHAVKSAKSLTATVKDPDKFIETAVDMAETGLRNLWVIPAAYYVAARQGVEAVAKNGDTAGIVEAVQAVLKDNSQKPAKPLTQKK